MNGSQFKTILDAAWRRKWLVAIPPVVGLSVAWYVLGQMPTLYRATVRIGVSAAAMPDTFVRTTVTMGGWERLNRISQRVLSPENLDAAITKFSLAPPDLSPDEQEIARQRLRSKVEITPDTKGWTFFDIWVVHKNGPTSADLANHFGALFVAENAALRTERASENVVQLRDWLERAKANLDRAETQLTVFRQRNSGQLPEQQNSNTQLITVEQQRVTGFDEQIRQNNDRLEILETQLRAMGGSTVLAPADVPVDPALARLNQLEVELRALMLDKTEAHPDVRRKRAEIEEYKRSLAGGTATGGAPASPEEALSQSLNQQIRVLRKRNLEIESSRIASNRRIDELMGRVRAAPALEQELGRLGRERDKALRDHNDLQGKLEAAERAQEIESESRAESYRLTAPANPPSAPFSPVPAQVLSMGVLIGLALGVGIAVLLEQLDPSMRSEDVFRRAFPDVPILAAIPNLLVEPPTKSGGRRGKKRARTAAAIATAVAILGGLA